MINDKKNHKLWSRLKLIGILSAFAVPVLIASALYFAKEQFDFGSVAKGNLLPPGQTLSDAAFHPIKAERGTATQERPLLDGRWLLLFNGAAACDLYCQANLFKMRQAKLVLGHNATRVRTVYLLSEDPDTALNHLLVHYPAFSVYQTGDIGRLAAQASELKQNSIHIVDPMGNLVLHYLPDAYAKDIIADLKRLLRVSKIG